VATASGRSLRDHAITWVLDSARAIIGARTPAEANALAEYA
jgi:hypothetical protein